jgi:hypothetical protein
MVVAVVVHCCSLPIWVCATAVLQQTLLQLLCSTVCTPSCKACNLREHHAQVANQQCSNPYSFPLIAVSLPGRYVHFSETTKLVSEFGHAIGNLDTLLQARQAATINEPRQVMRHNARYGEAGTWLARNQATDASYDNK